MSDNPRIHSFVGRESQLIFDVSDIVEVLHWGRRTEFDTASVEALRRAVPFGRLDKDVPLSLSPELGRGAFGSPAIEGHRKGQHWSPVFKQKQLEVRDNHMLFVSEDPIAGLQLTTEVTLDHDDVVKLKHKLTNLGPDDYFLNRLANTLPLPERACELMTFNGRWVKEFQTERVRLNHAGYQQENRRGRTSHEHYPALVVGQKHFTEQTGDVWGFHFAWSGNHRLRVDVKADGRRYMQAEVIYLPGEITLKPGESIETPWLYATYSSEGLNKMSQQFHAHVRNSILPKEFVAKPRPIHLNTWEGIYFDHDPTYIKNMASEAAQMGVERFIIDDGWFKGRNDDTAALGDWFLDSNKYPDGLMPVVEHVKGLGMEFGLWFEPEMINKTSELYKAHPDWLLQVDGYEQPTGRHQFVIDLQNDGAFEYLFERLDHFLSTYPIDYIKWDMNREIVQPAHKGIASGKAQVDRYYALVDKVRAAHPNVEIESCAAGGGRIDYEILTRTHRFWASDNNDALERQGIQRGMSYFFPPEVMGSHIGASVCHSTRRMHTIGFRGLTALTGHMGIELDPVKECEEEKQGFKYYMALHKQLRALLHSGVNWRIETDDDAQQAYAVVSKDQKQAVVLVAQLKMPTHSLSGRLYIPGLSKGAKYLVELVDMPSNIHNIVANQPAWMHNETILSGDWCEKVGLAMPLMDSETALLIKLTLQN